MNSSFSPRPAKARCSATATISFQTPPEDIDFDNAATMQAVVDKWTSLYAATSEKHDAAAFEPRSEATAFRPAASRSAIFSTSGPSIRRR